MVQSKAGNFDERESIRQTYGSFNYVYTKSELRQSDQPFKMAFVFVIGNPMDPKLQIRLKEESLHKTDILQGSFIETDINKTLKMMTSFKWILKYCPHAKHTVIVNDDIFIDIFQIPKFLNSYNTFTNILAQDSKLLFNFKYYYSRLYESQIRSKYCRMFYYYSILENVGEINETWDIGNILNTSLTIENKNGPQNEVYQMFYQLPDSLNNLVNTESSDWNRYLSDLNFYTESGPPEINIRFHSILCYVTSNLKNIDNIINQRNQINSTTIDYCSDELIIMSPLAIRRLFNGFQCAYINEDSSMIANEFYLTGLLTRRLGIPVFGINSILFQFHNSMPLTTSHGDFTTNIRLDYFVKNRNYLATRVTNTKAMYYLWNLYLVFHNITHPNLTKLLD